MDAPVDVRFGREVEDGIAAIRHRIRHGGAIADITFYESVSRVIDARQVFEISGVSEGVEIYDLEVGVFIQDQTNKRRSDKPCSACHENRFHKSATEN